MGERVAVNLIRLSLLACTLAAGYAFLATYTLEFASQQYRLEHPGESILIPFGGLVAGGVAYWSVLFLASRDELKVFNPETEKRAAKVVYCVYAFFMGIILLSRLFVSTG